MIFFAAVVCLEHLSSSTDTGSKSLFWCLKNSWTSFRYFTRFHPIMGEIETTVDVIMFYRISDLLRLSTVWVDLTQHKSISSPLTAPVL